MQKLFKYALIALSISPAYVFAGETGGGDGAVDFTFFTSLVGNVQEIVDLLIPLVVTLAVLFFFWGLAVFVLNAGDEEKRKEGRNIMVWGIIALFFIVAVWGIVRLLASIFGVDDSPSSITPPSVNTDTDGSSSIFGT